MQMCLKVKFIFEQSVKLQKVEKITYIYGSKGLYGLTL